MLFYGSTDVGKIRKNNEDSFIVKQYDENHILAIVADGMGGHAGGKQASSHAVDIISMYLDSLMPALVTYSPRKIKHEVLSSLIRANSEIFDESKSQAGLSGMGTTCVVCLAFASKLYVFNVGDSRLYLIDDAILQITKDHSYVNELLERGMIKEDEAANHPQKNILTRALGTESDIEPDLYDIKIKPGNKILLCSDGLTNMVTDNKIYDVVTSQKDVETAVKDLITLANENGGNDNITAVLIEA